MSKLKSYFVTVIIMALLGGIIWGLWSYALRSYYIVMQILGFYGFAVLGVNMAKWLAKPEPEKPMGWIPTMQDPDWEVEE